MSLEKEVEDAREDLAREILDLVAAPSDMSLTEIVWRVIDSYEDTSDKCVEHSCMDCDSLRSSFSDWS